MKIKNGGMVCGTCRFWQIGFDRVYPRSQSERDLQKLLKMRRSKACIIHEGYCHRYPPTAGPGVQTTESQWCGEWKEREAAEQ